jgi:hypothetical protein
MKSLLLASVFFFSVFLSVSFSQKNRKMKPAKVFYRGKNLFSNAAQEDRVKPYRKMLMKKLSFKSKEAGSA